MAEGDYEERAMRQLKCPQDRCGHVAVRLKNLMLVFGGYICQQRYFEGMMFYSEQYLPNNQIWFYNVDLNVWKQMSTGDVYPPGTSGASAVTIRGEIYMQGGHTDQGNTNSIWKLSWQNGSLRWHEIKIGNQLTCPSPRDKHVCWEYDDRLWQFGGFGPPTSGYSNAYGDFIPDGDSSPIKGWNNQLHVFDPVTENWMGIEGKGRVPSPRAAHALAQIGDRAFIHGGRSGSSRLADLYALDMRTLQWTALHCAGAEKPQARSWHSFTPLGRNEIVLHGGFSNASQILRDTWVLDVPSLTWSRDSAAILDHNRLWHTGVEMEDSIVIFGGCATNINDTQVPNRMCDDLFFVRRHPQSLRTLCLHAVFAHRHVNSSEWQYLPKELHRDLLILSTYAPTDRDESLFDASGHHAISGGCSIS
jgi:N-acetylneuraminic acid mutarotase